MLTRSLQIVCLVTKDGENADERVMPLSKQCKYTRILVKHVYANVLFDLTK